MIRGTNLSIYDDDMIVMIISIIGSRLKGNMLYYITRVDGSKA